VATIVAWTAYAIDQVMRVAANAPSLRGWAEMLVYFAITTLLTGSSLAYLFARLGYLYRTRDHHRVPRATIDDFFTESEPSLTVLVPSYREDGRIIRQTLLSAALQEYPSLGIVLLVDDPPNPTTARDLELLEDARSTPEWVQQLLETPRRRFTSALETSSDWPSTTSRLQRGSGQRRTTSTWRITPMSSSPNRSSGDSLRRWSRLRMLSSTPPTRK
jgi:cellulose synthase/poly-beta-1,6-N-acetylglucosamine synthase-like glycosyltransferase